MIPITAYSTIAATGSQKMENTTHHPHVMIFTVFSTTRKAKITVGTRHPKVYTVSLSFFCIFSRVGLVVIAFVAYAVIFSSKLVDVICFMFSDYLPPYITQD